jgi:pimeloyl-ACP methyl ester carboxylesterase
MLNPRSVLVWLFSATALLASPATAKQETMTWTNDDVKLVGDLILPETPGPHPALIFFHGSGDQTRKEILERIYASKFAAQGIALLLYDKRGCGDSTGDWRDADFEGLARDGLAGIAELKKRSDIDPKRIGVIGQSQGAWLGPLAATLSDDVRFVVAISGPTIPPNEQEIYRCETQMRADGLEDNEIAEAIQLVRLDHRLMDTGESAELRAALDAARTKPWFAKSPVKNVRDMGRPGSKFYARILHHDPVAVLIKLQVPLFAVFGERDVLVPGPRCAQELDALGKEMKIKPKVLLLPGAAHDLRVQGKGFLPEYWNELIPWILER